MFFTFTIDEYSVTKNVTLFSEPVGNSTLFWPNPDNATWTSTISITKYFVNFSSLAQAQEQLLFRLTIWLYSFILKFIPSIVLTIFTGFLIHALYKAEERSARLKNGRSTSANQSAPKREENQQERGVQTSNNLRVAVNNNGNVEAGVASNQPQPSRRRSTIHGKSSRKKSTDRTTRLLIVILVLFLLTEFPQVITYQDFCCKDKTSSFSPHFSV